jgi:hypothetical protein
MLAGAEIEIIIIIHQKDATLKTNGVSCSELWHPILFNVYWEVPVPDITPRWGHVHPNAGRLVLHHNWKYQNPLRSNALYLHVPDNFRSGHSGYSLAKIIDGQADCKAIEVLAFSDQSLAGTKGPFCIQIHNSGLYDEYKDIYVEESPTSDELLTTK